MDVKRLLTALVFLVIAAVPGIAGADELWLSNGDHLTGKVIGMEAGKLQFETTYAGKIAVSWKDITNLQTEAPISVVLTDGSVTKGTMEAGEGGTVQVKSGSMESPVAFRLSEVKQINPPPAGPPMKLNGRINIGVTTTGGNTETGTYYGEGKLTARSEKNRFILGARVNKEEDHGESTADSQTAYMKFDHFVSKKFFFQANMAGTKDKFRDLNLRTSFGLGAGYQFLETQRTNLSFEAGVNYVNEDHIVGEDDSYPAGGWGWHFDQFLFRKGVQFFHDDQGLVSLDNSKNIVIQSQTGLRFFLLKNLNATTQVNYDWDNSPPPGVKKADRTFLVTLGYDF